MVSFLPRPFRRVSLATALLHLREQERMISRLDAQNKVHPVVQQVADVTVVAAQAILDDDELQALDTTGSGSSARRSTSSRRATAADRHRRKKTNGSRALPRCNSRNTSPNATRNGSESTSSKIARICVSLVNLGNAEQGLEIVSPAALIEGQQRGILQREHGKGRHQCVADSFRLAGNCCTCIECSHVTKTMHMWGGMRIDMGIIATPPRPAPKSASAVAPPVTGPRTCRSS